MRGLSSKQEYEALSEKASAYKKAMMDGMFDTKRMQTVALVAAAPAPTPFVPYSPTNPTYSPSLSAMAEPTAMVDADEGHAHEGGEQDDADMGARSYSPAPSDLYL